MANSSQSDTVVTVDVRPFLMPFALVMSALILSGGMLLSANVLTRGGAAVANNGAVAGTGTTTSTAAPSAAPTTATVAVDDDPVLGDINKAKVVIIEFSDYECPFCQRFKKDTLGQLKDEYIASGEVALVFRDLPLSFHEPAASFAANVMECSQKFGGNDAYFKAHDWWFDNSKTNGAGVDNAKLEAYLGTIGLNGKQVLDCANSEEFAAEIEKDTQDANAAGITGTPGFVVGRLNGDGTVTGDVISGAYPFATFQETIEKYL